MLLSVVSLQTISRTHKHTVMNGKHLAQLSSTVEKSLLRARFSQALLVSIFCYCATCQVQTFQIIQITSYICVVSLTTIIQDVHLKITVSVISMNALINLKATLSLLHFCTYLHTGPELPLVE